MRSFILTVVLLSAASIVMAVMTPEDGPLCCGSKSVSLKLKADRFYECEDNKTANIPCYVSGMTLVNPGNIANYIIETDNEGIQTYADSYSIVRSPNYCVANWTSRYSYYEGPIIQGRILACTSQVTRRSHFFLGEMTITIIIALLLLLSGISSALTAVVYFFIPETQDIEGKCTFHLTVNQSVMYLLGSYWCLTTSSMEVNVLDDFCISSWYLFIFAVLAFFVWSTILSFDIRRRYRRNLRSDESKVMFWYLIIGYGIPAVLVLIGNIHIYGSYYFKDKKRDSDLSCIAHRVTMLVLYAILPILISQVTGAYFFLSLQRQLWSAQPPNAPKSITSKLRKFKFRLLLNVKMFVLTGLPCLLIVLCLVIGGLTRTHAVFLYVIIAILYFMACEGVVVFYMLVLSRKRILRGIAEYFGVTVTGWQPCPESEESIAYSNENQNDLGREL